MLKQKTLLFCVYSSVLPGLSKKSHCPEWRLSSRAEPQTLSRKEEVSEVRLKLDSRSDPGYIGNRWYIFAPPFTQDDAEKFKQRLEHFNIFCSHLGRREDKA
ncbi:hypothetical protein ACFL3G_12605, partial [Planctomycetota bacterium]